MWLLERPSMVIGSIVVSARGELVYAGNFSGTFKAGAKSFSSSGGTDLFLAKAAPDGTLTSARTTGGSGVEWVSLIAQDHRGYYMLMTFTEKTDAWGVSYIVPKDHTGIVVMRVVW